MLLAIDAGNTNIVFALYRGKILKGMWRTTTNAQRTSDEYAAFLLPLMKMADISISDVHYTILGSVVPEANFHIQRFCRDYFGTPPILVGKGDVDFGLPIKLERPEELGADRICDAVAAVAAYDLPLLIIDFGTATTFEVVNKKGEYIGGAIAPGINLSLEALHMAAAKLPSVAVSKTEHVIGTSTVDAIKSGIFWGYVGLIEGMISRIGKELGEAPSVIATGGLAPLFRDSVPAIQHLDPDLTIRGLQIIFDRNKKHA